ncbi:MAG: VWA domain-containing protein [Lentisphaerales bacterium]|nr:VWA domain-containing protein [Lentisphaerales bacterium]
MIEFVNTSWWPLSLIVLIIVALCCIWSEKKRRKTLNQLLESDMAEKLASTSCGVKRIWRNILFTAAWLFLAFALLRPFSGIDIEERQQSTRDIMILFDVSNSMNVVDAYGDSRLKYGKSLTSKLLKALPADRFGLMAFSGLAFTECPMTSDTYSFEAALDDMSSDKIPLGGTNIEIALDQALTEYSEGAPHKAIILISDGEEIGGDYTAASEKMKEKNIKVITVQTGDERKAGSVRDSKGRPLRDKQGQLLTSQADSKILKDVADKTGGIYLPFYPDGYSGQQLSQIVAHINNMKTGQGEKEVIRKPREIYQPFLLVAIVLLMVRMFLGERRNKTIAISTISLVFLTQTLLGQALPTQPQVTAPHGHMSPQEPQISEKQQIVLNKLRNEELKLQAETESETLEENIKFLSWYNLGLNLAKQHNIAPSPPQQAPPQEGETPQPTLFDRAAQAYATASSIPDKNNKLQASAIHNRAALFHREARKIYLQDPDTAISHLNEALAGYRQSLSILPADQKSMRNLQLTYLHLEDAELAKEMKNFHQQAAQNCGKALLEVRELKERKVLIDKLAESLKKSDEFVNKAKEKALELESQQHQQLYMHVSQLLTKSTASLSTVLNDQQLLQQTEKDIAEAYRLLGGNPDQPQDQNNQQNDQQGDNQDQGDQNKEGEDQKNQDQQNQDQKNQDQQNQDQKNQDQQNQDQQKQGKQDDQQESKSEDGKRDEEKSEDEKLNAEQQKGDFKKNQQQSAKQQAKEQKDAKVREAEALLRKMGDTEKKVREYIRQKRAEQMEKELMRKGIYVEPGENK